MPIPGIPVGFWEPVRLVDVTKSQMCMVSLGGGVIWKRYSKRNER
ncbi:conjugal DNA transfer TraU domain protein [Orientia tsutsugamushi str. Kato PP]|nr:conjugal DNA transfer TraU domain protein [Orientia tsutsugamushi str. Kato PP]